MKSVSFSKKSISLENSVNSELNLPTDKASFHGSMRTQWFAKRRLATWPPRFGDGSLGTNLGRQ